MIVKSSNVSADHEPSQSSSSPKRLGRLITVLGAAGAILPVLSLALYVLVRAGYDNFYGTFGVTPEEAGIGQGQMISRTALAVGALAIVLLLFLVIAVPWLTPIHAASDWWAFACMGVVLFGLGWLVSLREGKAVGFGSSLGLIALSYLFRAATLYAYHERERNGGPREPGLGQRLRRSAFAAPILSLVVALILFGAISLQEELSEAGNSAARQILDRESRRSAWFDFLLGVPVRQVDVVWLGDGKAPAEVKDLDRPLYLGEANGMTVLFDWQRNHMVRLPTGTIALCTTLTIEPDTAVESHACP